MSSLLEFFVPDHLRPRPVDSEGYELPPWSNPFFAIPPDDDQVEPSEPSEADYQWAAENLDLPPVDGSPAEDDPAGYDEWSRRLEEMYQASVWQDRLEAIYGPHGITDDDLAAAGLAVG